MLLPLLLNLDMLLRPPLAGARVEAGGVYLCGPAAGWTFLPGAAAGQVDVPGIAAASVKA